MKRNVYFSIRRGESQYVAECVDLPIVTQAVTLDELAENIKEAVELFLEDENLAELGFGGKPSIVANLELSLPEYA